MIFGDILLNKIENKSELGGSIFFMFIQFLCQAI